MPLEYELSPETDCLVHQYEYNPEHTGVEMFEPGFMHDSTEDVRQPKNSDSYVIEVPL